MKQWTSKTLRIVLGILMMYSFISLAYCVVIVSQFNSILAAIYFLENLAVPPVTVIILVYHLLTKVYPPEEKKDEVDTTQHKES